MYCQVRETIYNMSADGTATSATSGNTLRERGSAQMHRMMSTGGSIGLDM